MKRKPLSETEKWKLFQQTNAQRYVKHMKGLHPDCKGCNIGRKWVQQDYVTLMGSLREGVTLADLSLTLDRPVGGVSAKLRSLGLAVLADRLGYRLEGTRNLSKARVGKYYTDEMIQALLSVGWDYRFGQLVAPRWWAGRLILRGITMSTDDD